jgi:hypothetical protein
MNIPVFISSVVLLFGIHLTNKMNMMQCPIVNYISLIVGI